MQTNFIKTTDLSLIKALGVGGKSPLLRASEAIELIESKIPELQYFFAEPTITYSEDGGLKSAKWYSGFEHEVRQLDDLTGEKRARAEANLQSKLAIAAGYFDDPEIGELLVTMLNTASEQALHFIGTQPVLIDWATFPLEEECVDLRERLNQLYPFLFQGNAQGTTLPAGESPQNLVQNFSSGEGGAVNGVTGDKESLQQTDNVTYVDNTPFYHRLWFRILLFIAFAIAILLLLWWILFSKPGGLLVRPLSANVVHKNIISGLQNERDRLKGLLQAPCEPEARRTLSRGITGEVVPAVPTETSTSSLLPEEGTQNGGVRDREATNQTSPEVQSGDPVNEPRTQELSPQELAHGLEKSIAFILGAGSSGGVSMGSGFFIAKDIVITNRHVVEDADPSKIAVTSEVMGKIQKVKIVAMTKNSEVGTSDYAVLKLKSTANVTPLSLSGEVEKLSRVIAVGYPGYLTNLDPKLNALFEGDVSAAPETVFTSGEVSVIQSGFQGPPIIIHTADMSQGNSGGPLVDACGRVVGVNTFIGQDDQSGRRGLFSLGASDLMGFLDQHNISYQKASETCRPAQTNSSEQGAE